MSGCTHERRTAVWVEEEDWYSGQMVGRWEERVESTCEDESLHTYRCTMCGWRGHYSSNARDHYENGAELWWPDRPLK